MSDPAPRHPSLSDPRAKLTRAAEHLEALDEESKAFADREPFELEQVREGDWILFRIRVREEPPAHLGLVLGDLLHNLRSALESLVWQLVLLDEGEPDQSTTFPVTRSAAQFRKAAARSLEGLVAAHVAKIEALQPYPERSDPVSRAVGAVHEMARIDRHRTIHAVFAGASKDDPVSVVKREPLEAEFSGEIEISGYGKPLTDGAELARMRFWADKPQPPVKLKGELGVEIGFGDRGLRVKALASIAHFVEQAIEQFAGDFDDPELGGSGR